MRKQREDFENQLKEKRKKFEKEQERALCEGEEKRRKDMKQYGKSV